MTKIPEPNPVYRFFFWVDSWALSALYELRSFVRRAWGAYASLLEHFRLSGPVRILVDLLDDALTFALGGAVLATLVAIPPFDNTGDIWNRGRQYAMTFTDEHGQIIGRRGVLQDDAIPLEEIPANVVHAVLATEDARFYEHFGIDLQGLLRALVVNAQADQVVQGGSTLTQQLAKNLFLSPERSIKRKIHEAFMALWIESRLSKDQILKLYLDRSYLGGGTYGVEAASQYYFGKSVRDVNLAEAAVLGGLFKAPSNYAPHSNPEASKARTNIVLYRMLDVGFISQGELFEARQHPAQIVNQADYYVPDWFLDWAYKQTLDLITEQNLTSDYVIEVKTTVDLNLQKQAQKIINEALDNDAPAYNASQAALVTMKPDGALVAIVGGRDYAQSQFNRATDALRQPGSSFKPFVYLTALMNGFTPTTTIYDAPITIGTWSPKNYTLKYAGKTNLTTALAHSYNTPPIRIMQAVGRKAIIDTAHAAGIKSNLLAVPSLPLGTNEVTVMDLTTGYATFANGGRLARPYTVSEIRTPSGEVLYDRAKVAGEAPQVLPLDKIEELNQMMAQVVKAGTGTRALLGFTPQAGKTGTTQSYRDAWFVGYTAHYVTGVWFGNDDHTEMKKMTGGTLPAITWNRYMMIAEAGHEPAALAGLPVEPEHLAAYDEYRKQVVADAAIEAAPPSPETTDGPAVTDASAPTDEAASADAAAPDAQSGGAVSTRQEPDAAVVAVLQDMMGLFEQQPVQKTRQQAERRKATVDVTPPVDVYRPGAGTRQNFRGRAFGDR
ncbi:MAG: PBP1A family penicillin-binding protein [Hyphomicrobiales bacterium]